MDSKLLLTLNRFSLLTFPSSSSYSISQLRTELRHVGSRYPRCRCHSYRKINPSRSYSFPRLSSPCRHCDRRGVVSQKNFFPGSLLWSLCPLHGAIRNGTSTPTRRKIQYVVWRKRSMAFFFLSLGCSRQTVSWIFIILSETYNPGLDTSVVYQFFSATDVTATGRPKSLSQNCLLRCRLLSGLLGNVHCA